MTAAELLALVKDWPKEAWPPALRFVERGNHGTNYWSAQIDQGAHPVACEHAALLFFAAGMIWLMNERRGYNICCWRGFNATEPPELWVIRNATGESPLHALSAAILAAKESP
jgi:hypothetical protein